MGLLHRPVYFMGQNTGLLATSKRHASIAVFHWLCRGHGPAVSPEYCPVHHRYAGVPTLGRLYKNTRLENERFAVGLGLPDRRQSS